MEGQTNRNINSIQQSRKKLILTALASMVFSGWSSVALADGYGGWGRGMMSDFGHGGFGGMIMIAFWIAAAVGIYFLIKWVFQSTGDRDAKKRSGINALDILKERYARGEIGREEFERMRLEIESVR